MNEEQSLRRAIDEPVRIVEYDPKWPALFTLERDRLLALFPEKFVAIEHFGSTAVPGLSAKPVIDLVGGVESMVIADSLLEPLCREGYNTSTEFNATLKGRRWLMRWKDGHRTHHLHLVVHEGAEWRRRLVFRDILRRDGEIAGEYEKLKKRLAADVGGDREAYTEAKGEFVARALGTGWE